MKRRIVRPQVLIFGLLLAGSTIALTGCEDPFEPFLWGDFPDTTSLYSLARAEYVDRPGAYSILPGGGKGPVTVEGLSRDPFAFDFAVSESAPGSFVLLPTGVFPDADARPGILVDDTASFDGLSEAPSGGYTTDAPVPAEVGPIYVIRSRQTPNGCHYYGKMEILELDPAGIAMLRVLANVNCSDRSLVPNAPIEDDDDGGDGSGSGDGG